jgi:hypothetical protein
LKSKYKVIVAKSLEGASVMKRVCKVLFDIVSVAGASSTRVGEDTALKANQALFMSSTQG